ncbi:Rv3235 family protein [Blastococcus montanus]|uniref:Rv3235 family protein n=1 Tax=Blastococcus montanus TaxID=3144973 RepID=UPI0032082C38
MTAPSRPAPPAGRSALRLTVVPTPQPPLDPRPALRLVQPGRPVPRPVPHPGPRPRTWTGRPADEFGPVPTGRSELPSAGETGRRLLTTALEALAGRRPLAQVRPLTSAGVYAALSAGRRPVWCAAGHAPVLLGRVRVCEPVDGVAEISAVAYRDGRAHAVAARLEGLDGRWRCTALQIG